MGDFDPADLGDEVWMAAGHFVTIGLTAFNEREMPDSVLCVDEGLEDRFERTLTRLGVVGPD